MRKLVILSSLLFFFSAAFGQIFDPVKWDFSVKKISDTEFDLVSTAKIDNGWYVYSQFLESDEGPVATSLHFTKGSNFSLVGKAKEISSHRKELNDPLFDNMKVVKFSDEVAFAQRVKVTDASKPIAGYLEFMTCDNERCLPPAEVEFSFNVKATAAPASKIADTKTNPSKETVQDKPAEVVATDDAPVVASPPAKEGILEPVHWGLEVQKLSDTEYSLAFKATVDKGWYIYSQNVGEDGPIPTAIFLPEGSKAELVGKAAEESAHKVEGHDEMFDMIVTKYKEEVIFRQKIKVADANESVSGVIAFMTCDDSRCLPEAEVPFSVTPATLAAQIGDGNGATAGTGETLTFGAFVLDKSQAAECGEIVQEAKKSSLWGIFILGFIGGLLALLTPCVFPMIPLTVSFFTKGSENRKKGIRNAAMYGFFIFAVYLILSLPFHLLDSVNADILNEMSTNVILNVVFFLIFLFFAFSFFGYYEITLPSSWSNKASSAESVGGIVGIFFMALTLALVSFSCTGPILGTLLAGALSGDGGAMQLTAGMGGFGLALALPFGLFAAFPSWLSSLPKSGGWMTSVKVTLGFLELAAALKFLSNADLVKHWGIVKIELFLGAWILIFIALGLYLLGKIRFPHDSKLKKLPPLRLAFAVASFAFAAYLGTGFIYDQEAGSLRSLKLLSGLAPPSGYSWLYPKECPANLDCFKDFDQGLAYAKKMNKPIMIDFTGYACVNCRKMEEHVWPDPSVYKHLKEDFVLISLYVDDKKELPEAEQVTVDRKTGGTRKLRTVGQKWQHMQTELFENNSQPYYVLLSPDGKLLNNPVGYTPAESDYTQFLQCGLDSFHKQNEGKGILGEK